MSDPRRVASEDTRVAYARQFKVNGIIAKFPFAHGIHPDELNVVRPDALNHAEREVVEYENKHPHPYGCRRGCIRASVDGACAE
jgi:hypothetical protein